MIKNLLSRLKKEKESSNQVETHKSSNHAYHNTIDIVRKWIELENNTQDKILLLDFVMDSIRTDLQYDTLTTILYSEEHFKERLPVLFLPYYYYNEKGERLETYVEQEESYKVNLSKDCVIVLPWNRHRLRDSIKNISSNPFKYDKINHFAYYYTSMDVCYVYNGLHSITAGIVHRKGEILAQPIEVEAVFRHLDTDGEAWINTHTKEKYDEVFDFRFAILYELARIKYNLFYQDTSV